jgi:hypothetical protein
MNNLIYKFILEHYKIIILGSNVLVLDLKTNNAHPFNKVKNDLIKIFSDTSIFESWYDHHVTLINEPILKVLDECEVILGRRNWSVKWKNKDIEMDQFKLAEQLIGLGIPRDYILKFYVDWYDNQVTVVSDREMREF